MRILAPLILALFGAAIGLLVNFLFKRSWIPFPIAAIIGAISAFVGMILRDAFDATILSSDQLLDTLLAALLMSLVVSVIAHVISLFVSPKH